ncbi:MAG: T9SS type A sorting domain-containing protein [Flavobacteriales bacterium]|nr:T9SS type A sorting domain-containing protein [Flavobacteriales bacterium]
MRFILLPFAVVCLGLHAQVFDVVHQPGLEGQYRGVAPTATGRWAMVGHNPLNNSFFSSAIFVQLEQNGETMEEHAISIPNNELTILSCVAELGTDTFLLAGTTSYGCDFGPFLGLLMAWTNGAPLWSRTYGGDDGWTEFGHMAVGDSTVLLPMSDGLLITDHDGDSLYWSSTGWLNIRSIRAIEGNFIVAGYQGLLSLEQDGELVDQWTDAVLFDVAAHPSGGYVAVGMSGLYRFDEQLQLIGGPVALGMPSDGSHRTITWVDSKYHVITVDTLWTLDEDLNILSAHPFEAPDGYTPSASIVANGTAFTCGWFNCGAVGAAARTMSLDGDVPDQVPDIALHGVTAFDLEYTVYPSTMINYVSGSFSAGAWLVNHGEDTLMRATLDQYLPWGICGPAGATYQLTDLMLAPDDSTWVTAGPFYLTAYVDTGLTTVEREVCIWAASPNDRMDGYRTDNSGCGLVTILLSLEESLVLGQLIAYPNPFNDHVLIEGIPLGVPVSIELQDAMGRSVHGINGSGQQGQLMLDVVGLAAGPYLLQVRTGKEHRTMKLWRMP